MTISFKDNATPEEIDQWKRTQYRKTLKSLTHDKALQAAMMEYGRFVRVGEGSTKAVERAIEVYNYVMDQNNEV